MKIIKYMLLISLLYALPSIGIASDVEMPSTWQPAVHDDSVHILNFFVNGLIGSDESRVSGLLSSVFLYLNLGALLIGIFLIFYGAGHRFLKSFSSPEALQNEDNTGAHWATARSITGIMLLIPGPSGFSFIQHLVLWVVLRGIGLADTLWTETINYLYNPSESKIVSEQQSQRQTDWVAHQIGFPVLENVMCMMAHNQILENIDSTFERPYELVSYPAPNSSQDWAAFGKAGYDSDTRGWSCGGMYFTNETSSQPIIELAENLSSVAQNALQERFTDEDVLAFNDAIQWFMFQVDAQNPKEEDPEGDPLVVKAKYISDHGWITAGAFYRDIFKQKSTEIEEITSSDEFNVEEIEATDQAWIFDINQRWLNATHQIENTNLRNSVYSNQNKSPSNGTVKPLIDWDNVVSGTRLGATLQDDYDTAITSTFGVRPGYLTKNENESLITLIGTEDAFNLDKDPFANVVAIGAFLMQATKDDFARLRNQIRVNIAKIAALDLVSNLLIISIRVIPYFFWFPFRPIVRFVTAMAVLFPVVAMNVEAAKLRANNQIEIAKATTNASIFYPLGAMLAFYLPLVPFVIFFMGALGWTMLILEALISAPLLALGLMFSEGEHKILGKVNPALTMGFNLLLRPALMIFGFVAALSICWIGFVLLQMLINIVYDTQGFASAADVGGPIIIMFSIAMLFAVITTKAFGLIHHIPNTCLRWIGDRTQSMVNEDDGLTGLLAEMDKSSQGQAKAFGDVEQAHADSWQKGADSVSRSPSDSIRNKVLSDGGRHI